MSLQGRTSSGSVPWARSARCPPLTHTHTRPHFSFDLAFDLVHFKISLGLCSIELATQKTEENHQANQCHPNFPEETRALGKGMEPIVGWFTKCSVPTSQCRHRWVETAEVIRFRFGSTSFIRIHVEQRAFDHQVKRCVLNIENRCDNSQLDESQGSFASQNFYSSGHPFIAHLLRDCFLLQAFKVMPSWRNCGHNEQDWCKLIKMASFWWQEGKHRKKLALICGVPSTAAIAAGSVNFTKGVLTSTNTR